MKKDQIDIRLERIKKELKFIAGCVDLKDEDTNSDISVKLENVAKTIDNIQKEIKNN